MGKPAALQSRADVRRGTASPAVPAGQAWTSSRPASPLRPLMTLRRCVTCPCPCLCPCPCRRMLLLLPLLALCLRAAFCMPACLLRACVRPAALPLAGCSARESGGLRQDRSMPATPRRTFWRRVAASASCSAAALPRCTALVAGRCACCHPSQRHTRTLLGWWAQVRSIAMEVGNAVHDDGYVPVICGLSRTRPQVRPLLRMLRLLRMLPPCCAGAVVPSCMRMGRMRVSSLRRALPPRLHPAHSPLCRPGPGPRLGCSSPRQAAARAHLHRHQRWGMGGGSRWQRRRRSLQRRRPGNAGRRRS